MCGNKYCSWLEYSFKQMKLFSFKNVIDGVIIAKKKKNQRSSATLCIRVKKKCKESKQSQVFCQSR